MSNNKTTTILPINKVPITNNPASKPEKKTWRLFEPNYSQSKNNLKNDFLEKELGMLATTIHTNLYYPKYNKDRLSIRNPMKRRNFSTNNMPNEKDIQLEKYWTKLNDYIDENSQPKVKATPEKITINNKIPVNHPNLTIKKFNINNSNPQSPKITKNTNNINEVDDLNSLIKRNKRSFSNLELFIDENIKELNLINNNITSQDKTIVKIIKSDLKKLEEFYTNFPLSMFRKRKLNDAKHYKNIMASFNQPSSPGLLSSSLNNNKVNVQKKSINGTNSVAVGDNEEKKNTANGVKPSPSTLPPPTPKTINNVEEFKNSVQNNNKQYSPTMAVIRIGKMRYSRNGELKRLKSVNNSTGSRPPNNNI